MKIFTASQSIAFIEKAFGEGKPSNGGLNISVLCPKCVASKPFGYNKKKLVIRTDNFLSHCWVCGTKSKNLLPWLKASNSSHIHEYITTFLQAEQLTDEEVSNETPQIVLPLGFRLLAVSNDYEALQARRYLAKERGLGSVKDLWYWKFGITSESPDCYGRIIMPSFNSLGELNYWTARKYKRTIKGPKYHNPEVSRETIIFNEINIDWTKPLTIVEGPMDLVKCNSNATCLLGSILTPEYALFQQIVEHQTPVVLALDNDAKAKALQIAKDLTEFDIPVTMLEVSATKGDVGAMSKSEFSDLLTTGVKLNSTNLLLEKIKMLFSQDNR